MWRYLKNRRRRRLREAPFPEAWDKILRTGVRYYARLPTALQEELRAHTAVFLAEKHFEGCGGQRITDEVRVSIASLASLLLLGLDTDHYPGLQTILVYPDAFLMKRDDSNDLGMVSEEEEVGVGESWSLGAVVLSWAEIKADLRVFNGRNVILHEFAHQLYDNGEAYPASVAEAQSWVELFDRHFERHCRGVAGGRRTFLDEYGAEDPAEFFSVITEAFFEKPVAFQQRLPDLYDGLRKCYRQDPASYFQA